MSFSSLGLSESILKALSEKNYETPTPIQAQAIPAVLSGKDLMAAAQTGTGKTAGFTLPLLHRLADGKKASSNQVRALILTPTRELAAQIAENVEMYGKHLNLNYVCVFGGVKINPQMMALRKGADVLVATPGRLMDLFNQRAVRFDELETLVLDEADRMLDMGFIHDIKRILKLLPTKRQNLMFSATFSDDIKTLAKGLMNDPVEVSVSPANATANTVNQMLYEIDRSNKSKLLIKLIKQNNWQQVLVFSRTKHGANRLARNLDSKNITAAAIHGDKSQGARTRALANFKDGSIRVLVATDIAARGIDINELPQVINFDMPNIAEDYVHRIGRTGRAGSEGIAVSFVCEEEFDSLSKIEQLIQKHIDRSVDEEFKPSLKVPASRPIRAPQKKKPKKVKSLDLNSDDAEKKGSMGKGSNKPNNRSGSGRANNNSGARRSNGPRKANTSNRGSSGAPRRSNNG
ncbi:DEAD/DEAH box helicase [Psychrosphaera sp. B3R10]|nr:MULTISPECIES: DEAD/DEAH box helicase [unclassified Psychrosphaera]MBU2882133.1 DEAD/DEAH box helicase [Psychrosphaera sp. I2R16]MBU2988814.1 DEAD/DEAH box helicase [Psychrosphaera sp. B3R10]MDO6717834.1 DEAD/DEAH box helicase [Psychrosphaera sp. 1_MG-2023]